MSGNGWIKISEKSFAQRFDVAMTPFSSAKINQNWLDIYAVSGLKLDGVLYEKHLRNGAVKLCMTHFDSSARAWEVQSKFLTELLLTKREEAKLKLEFGLHPRKTFWLIKYYFPFTCKNVYFCFLFSPQIVKSILAFLSFKNDVMARSTRYFSQISTLIWEIVIVYLYL